MSNKTLLDSLDRDEALGFFEGGIPGADNVISQEVENSDDSGQAPKTVDPRKNPNFNKPVEDLDFEISDLIRENIPEVLEDDRIDYTKNDEDDEDDFEKELNYVYIKDRARKVIIEEFDKRLETTIKHRTLGREVSYRYLIRLELYKLVKHLTGEKEYEGFNIWW